MYTLTGHSNGIECLLSVPHRKAIASGAGNGDKTLKIWNVENGDCISTLLDVHKGGGNYPKVN